MTGYIRSWKRSPLVAIQYCVTVAVGIGSLAALVSLMFALGFQPLPFRDSGQLVAVWQRAQIGAKVMALSGPKLTDFSNSKSFDWLGAFAIPKVWLIGDFGPTEVRACDIQAKAFNDLGMKPVLGRAALEEDEPVNSASSKGYSSVWISYRLWQSRYGLNPSIIGTRIKIGDSPTPSDRDIMQVVGVLPPDVRIPLPFLDEMPDVWYLLERNVSGRPRAASVFFGVGRLRYPTTAMQAQSALNVVAERLGNSYAVEQGKVPVVQGLNHIVQGPVRQTMGLLLMGVILVFLLGYANLAIMTGVEGRHRRREIAIRVALGATHWRLWREVAFEKSMLTAISVALGIAFAKGLLRVLTQLLPAAGLGPPLPNTPPLNLTVLLAFCTLSLVAGLVWSFLLISAADGPAASRTCAASGSGLGYATFNDSSPTANRWHLMFLALQAAVGICLFAIAALSAQTYSSLSTNKLGPDSRQTVLLSIRTRDNVQLNDAQITDFDNRLTVQLERIPGTKAAALVDLFPPPGFPIQFVKQGESIEYPRQSTLPISISTSYFDALGIPILLGRHFTSEDGPKGERVAIISLEMAKHNWTLPAQAIGSYILVGTEFKSRYRIVGVANDYSGYWSQEAVPTIYLPATQSINWSSQAIIHTSSSSSYINSNIRSITSNLPIPVIISDVSTIHERWQSTLTRPLARMLGMLLLATLGLGLTIQGVFAVAANTVTARKHELAVRTALGARPPQILWSLIRQLLFAVIGGSLSGLFVAFALRPLMEHFLGPLAVWEPGPFLGATIVLAFTTVAGCYIPARAALRTSPSDVLRQG